MARPEKIRLGDLLIKQGLLPPDELAQALKEQQIASIWSQTSISCLRKTRRQQDGGPEAIPGRFVFEARCYISAPCA